MVLVNVRRENILRSNNHRWNYKIENLHTDVACCYNSNKMGLCVTFSGIKGKTFDSCTLVYTRLVTSLHSSSDSSTLVYIRLVTRPHSSRPRKNSVFGHFLRSDVRKNLCTLLIPLCKNNLSLPISYTDHYALRKKEQPLPQCFYFPIR